MHIVFPTLAATATATVMRRALQKIACRFAIHAAPSTEHHIVPPPHNPSARAQARKPTLPHRAPRPPVRIWNAPSSSCKLVMSGRMDDVCAELDRLAAREAALMR